MQDKLIDIIYNEIEHLNFYNYDNDEELKDVTVRKYTNVLNEKTIDVKIGNETYTIVCIKTFDGDEH